MHNILYIAIATVIHFLTRADITMLPVTFSLKTNTLSAKKNCFFTYVFSERRYFKGLFTACVCCSVCTTNAFWLLFYNFC